MLMLILILTFKPFRSHTIVYSLTDYYTKLQDIIA